MHGTRLKIGDKVAVTGHAEAHTVVTFYGDTVWVQPPLATPAPFKRESALTALADIGAEVVRARSKFTTPFHNAHEGYAVMLEEVDELWAHVKTNQARRDLPAMRNEAVQAAAMLVRFITEICDDGKGRV